MKKTNTQRGTIMIETVFLLPLLMILVSMLVFSGYQMVNIHKGIKMARYETWRDVHDAPGPGSDQLTAHQALNNTFFPGINPELSWAPSGRDNFPHDAYEEAIDFSSAHLSAEGADLHEAWLYLSSENRRIVAGWREGFSIYHPEMPFNYWNQFNTNIPREHQRIHQYWIFTNDPLASADTWEGRPTPLHGGGETEVWRTDTEHQNSGIMVHHKRAVRDIFLDDLDTELDNIDGDASREYSSDPTERPNTSTMAGFIRSLYLNQPRYRGPIVTE